MRQPPRRPRLVVPTWLTVGLVYFACYGLLFPPQFMPQVWAATPAEAEGDSRAAALRDSVRATNAGAQLAGSVYADYAALGLHPTTLWKQLSTQPEFSQRDQQPDALLDWVTKQTRWVPYRGAVRGAHGVVLDRQGNHADRALLLWELLRLAGHPARLAHGTLDPAVAADLVVPAADHRSAHRAAMSRAVRDAEGQADDPGHSAFAEAIDRAYREAGYDDPVINRQAAGLLADAQTLSESMSATRSLQSAALIEAIENADLIPDADEGDDQAEPATAMSDHWWVQIPDGERWHDLDPLLSLGTKTDYRTPDPITTFATPQDMAAAADAFQQVTVRIVAESADAADLSRTTLLESVVLPADLTSKTLTLSIEPIGLDARVNLALTDLDPDEAWAETRLALLEQQLWVPVLLIDGAQVHARGVDAAGRIVEDPPVGRSTGSAIKSKLGDAIGALGNAGDTWDPEGPQQLHGLAIEFVTQVPGRPAVIERRVIYDALGGRTAASDQPQTPQTWWANTDARAASATAQTTSFDETARLRRALELQWNSQLALLNCQMPAALLAAKQAQAVKASRPAILKALAANDRARRSDSGNAETLEALSEAQGSDSPLWAFAVLRHTTGTNADDAKLYYDRPTIVGLHATAGLRPDGLPAVTYGFDIVTAGTGVDADHFAARFRARITQGAADAAAEGALNDLFQTDRATKRFAGGPATAAGRLEADTAANQPWTAAPSSAGLTVFNAAVSGPATPHYVVASDGTTIGIDVHGWGGITAEYVIMLGLGMFISSMVVMVICLIAASLVGRVAGAVDGALQDAGVGWALPGKIAADPEGFCVATGICGMAIGLAVAIGAAAYAGAAGISVSATAAVPGALRAKAFVAGLIAKKPCTMAAGF